MLTPPGGGCCTRLGARHRRGPRRSWGVRREASGREDSDQWPVKPQGGAGGDRKAPKRSQIARVLVTGTLRLRTNDGRMERGNEANLRRVARRRGSRGVW